MDQLQPSTHADKLSDLDFRRAPVFFGLFTALIGLGAGLALLPGMPVMRLLVAMQVLNGVLLPILRLFILRLSNDPRLSGDLHNTRLANELGWGTCVRITTAVVVMLGSQLDQLLVPPHLA